MSANPVLRDALSSSSHAPPPPLLTIADYASYASSTLERRVYDFYAGAGADEQTLHENTTAWARLRLRPKVLIDVAKVDTHTRVLGIPISSPLCIAPSAMQMMAHHDGEAATVKAAGHFNTICGISCGSNLSLEDIRAAASPSTPLFFQIYVYNDKKFTTSLIKRAVAAGYQALILTVDHPYIGIRERDMRNEFIMPSWLVKGNFSDQDTKSPISERGVGKSDHAGWANSSHDQSITWNIIDWIRQQTSLPIIVKGVLTREDATLACQHGAAAVFVSNHGGRQLDSVASTIEALPEVVSAVKYYNQSSLRKGAAPVEVYVDGGVRRGSDIFKAVALGANAVFIGRPVLWGLTYAGEEGVKQILNILQQEFELVMTLCGCPSLQDVDISTLASSPLSITYSPTVSSSVSSTSSSTVAPPPYPPHPLINLDDYQAYARYHLPPAIYQYYRSGARDEQTLQENRFALDRIRIRPRYMINVTKIDTRTTVLGLPISSPILIAPTAMQAMAHIEGERATARAAQSFQTVMSLSTISNTSIEDVRKAAPSVHLWYQLYVYNSRELTASLVKRAAAAGYTAIVVTVDTPVVGGRDAEMRHKFVMPRRLVLANFDGQLRDLKIHNVGQRPKLMKDPLTRSAAETWSSVDWLRSLSSVPIVLKGILTAEAALLACEHGAAGIIVSNHGGRQLDGVPATSEALPAVVAAVRQYNKTHSTNVEVYVDGNIRRGSDILKSLCLGARAVLIGRPVIWGLVAGGESGVSRVLNLLQHEFITALALSGCPTLEHCQPDRITTADELRPKL